ncbi:hypothetical protein OUZ56_013822 [Daphnia magna]|uniref:Uncharacterized protein n=1 Tax=Daphnia magna TaxID=35525 RepID=A0ABQ9Z718_9CRUS|nr:hypothetical protein OUZ56_013822 [Daphnia magna]
MQAKETKENEKKKNEIIQPNHNIVVFINFTAKVMEPPLPLLLPDCCRRRHTHGRRRALFKPQKSLKNSFMSSLKHKISALMCRISRARQEVVVAVGSERRSEEETSSSRFFLDLICHNCRIWLALTVCRPAKGEISPFKVERLVRSNKKKGKLGNIDVAKEE